MDTNVSSPGKKGHGQIGKKYIRNLRQTWVGTSAPTLISLVTLDKLFKLYISFIIGNIFCPNKMDIFLVFKTNQRGIQQ
jgi:hypothetical protein